GGTKTVLALFEMNPEGLSAKPVAHKVFPSDQYGSLKDIIEAFMAGESVTLDAASFGVAGPVVNGRSHITNLPWVVDTAVIQNTLKIERVGLLNDLESIANAVPYLKGDKDLFTLSDGTPKPKGAKAVIAPGTGLGEAFLVWEEQQQRYEAHPSEGGHASFAPTTPLQQELLTFLHGRMGHVSFERVCSGSGIPNLYTFFRDTGRYEEPEWLRNQLATVNDMTPTIVNTAVSGKAAICVATLNLFIEILAGETANIALKMLATGGVYLGGGIPPRILPQIQVSNFNRVFTNKGRFTDLLADIPIYLIRDPQVALLGAAYHGFKIAAQ
ncbi:MAG: glucokinase, partial [Anaerolineales bacterium]|nr:glucokinase [Anaerolineales bacterium]